MTKLRNNHEKRNNPVTTPIPEKELEMVPEVREKASVVWVVPVKADFYKPLFLPQGTKVVGVAVDPIRQCPVVFTVNDGGEGQ